MKKITGNFEHSKLLFLTVFRLQEDAGGTDGEEGAILNDATLTGSDFGVVDKGAGVAVGIAEDIAQAAPLVAADVDDAVEQVDAGVDGLDGGGDGVALLIAANGVVAHLQGENLLEVEDVLDDDDGAEAGVFGLFRIGVLLALGLAELRHTDADAELLAALGALEHQRLTSLILSLVESDVVIALGTADALHGELIGIE